jgi:hypothetical protein
MYPFFAPARPSSCPAFLSFAGAALLLLKFGAPLADFTFQFVTVLWMFFLGFQKRSRFLLSAAFMESLMILFRLFLGALYLAFRIPFPIDDPE